MVRHLRTHGCTPKQGKGGHEKWYCPCGRHMTVVTQTREVSPGLARQPVERLECLPEGMAAMSNTYTARAVRWEHGWELHVDGVGVTQVRVLRHAEQQVRDLVATVTDVDDPGATVVVRPDLGGLECEVEAARRESEAATAAQVKAGERSRQAAEALRSFGLSVTDTATVLGVSRGRVSQLVGH